MPIPQSQINNQLFKKVNDLEADQSETKGYLKAIVEQNEKLIGLLTKSQSHLKHALVLGWMFAFMCLGALIYGAIGKEGLYSVRRTLPNLPPQSAAIPAHNDFDKWRYRAA